MPALQKAIHPHLHQPPPRAPGDFSCRGALLRTRIAIKGDSKRNDGPGRPFLCTFPGRGGSGVFGCPSPCCLAAAPCSGIGERTARRALSPPVWWSPMAPASRGVCATAACRGGGRTAPLSGRARKPPPRCRDARIEQPPPGGATRRRKNQHASGWSWCRRRRGGGELSTSGWGWCRRRRRARPCTCAPPRRCPRRPPRATSRRLPAPSSRRRS